MRHMPEAAFSEEVGEEHVVRVIPAIDQSISSCTHRTNGQHTKLYLTPKPYYTKPYYCAKPCCTNSRKLSCTISYYTNFGRPSSIAIDQVPSACYRKGQRRKDIDLTTYLWNDGEPHYLPGKQGGTWSKLLSTSWVLLPAIGYTEAVNECK